MKLGVYKIHCGGYLNVDIFLTFFFSFLKKAKTWLYTVVWNCLPFANISNLFNWICIIFLSLLALAKDEPEETALPNPGSPLLTVGEKAALATLVREKSAATSQGQVWGLWKFNFFLFPTIMGVSTFCLVYDFFSSISQREKELVFTNLLPFYGWQILMFPHSGAKA